MNARQYTLLFPIFLVASLLFSQVGVGYLHDKHDAHERIDSANRDQTQLHKHGEHCKVCSVDLFSSLFIANESLMISGPSQVVTQSIASNALQTLPLRFFEGRAPPAI